MTRYPANGRSPDQGRRLGVTGVRTGALLPTGLAGVGGPPLGASPGSGCPFGRQVAVDRIGLPIRSAVDDVQTATSDSVPGSPNRGGAGILASWLRIAVPPECSPAMTAVLE